MSYVVVVRSLAEAELAEASAWYELQAPGLGAEFLDEFERSAQAIAEGPLHYPLYHQETRRHVMARFPYVIYFDLRPAKVRILRVVHGARDPKGIPESLE